MKHKIITFGEIMLRLATRDYKRFSQTTNFKASFGGGEANVAVSLSNFGMDTQFVSCIPNNDIGNTCMKELQKHGVGTHHMLRGGDRLGIYFLETGAVNRPGKVIYDRAFSAFSQLEKGMINWDMVFKDATWFHWTGITPAISQSTAEVCLEAIQKANEKGMTVSCDLNYRSKLWKYGKTAREVMPELVAGCDIILGNEEDAEKTLGIKAKGANVLSGDVKAEEYRPASEQIMKCFPKAKKVVTTLRGSISASHNTWSGVLYDGKTLFKAHEYNITHIVDRIGGGDAFMAGLIYGLITFNDDQKVLNFAAAASCLKHTIHGDFNLVTVEEVEKLMSGDQSGRVVR
ncbi:MAG: sugar kinase [Bacteroidales bacterium]|nr:sugar kinase [Bacteroidales bacterium]